MTTPATAKKRGTLEFVVTFLALFFVVQWGLGWFFPDQFGNNQEKPAIQLTTSASVREGHHPIITIHNNTDEDLTIADRCPAPPFDIAYLGNSADGSGEVIIPDDTILPCPTVTTVPAHSSQAIDFGPWKYSLFSRLGMYRATLDVAHIDALGLKENPSVEFHIDTASGIVKLFRALVTKPLLNSLVFIASLMNTHSLGWSVIILTIIIKFLLFFPSQHAMEGQRKLQILQPKLDEIKKKHRDDIKKQQEETMRLWKEHKINPLQSCLPLVIQFPILIGLFYTIRDGAILVTSRHLLYPVYAQLPWTFSTMFYGLDLTKPSHFIFPPLLVVLQFLQMWMMMKRKKTPEKVIDTEKKKFSIESIDQQTIMMYTLPIMIGVFAWQFPAAVSLYWGVSTLFAIGQQWYVNSRKKL